MALSQLFTKKHMAVLTSAVCFVILDRFLKALAITLGQEKVLIKNWLDFSLIKNNNAAFSLTLGFDIVWLAIIITLLAIIWLGFSLKKKEYLISLALAMLILGSLSNIYDRIIYGAVIDYFSFANLNIFNLADVLIVVGAIILLYKEFKAKN